LPNTVSSKMEVDDEVELLVLEDELEVELDVELLVLEDELEVELDVELEVLDEVELEVLVIPPVL
jgi:hypothetical protein